jgi:hypothetical protein
LRGVTPRPPSWLRLLSLSGLMMTILYVVMAIFPIIKVESVATFALKVSGLIVIANVVGFAIFLTAGKRRDRYLAERT